MANFNFKEEDLLKENKKKKDTSIAKQKVEQKWAELFPAKQEQPQITKQMKPQLAETKMQIAELKAQATPTKMQFNVEKQKAFELQPSENKVNVEKLNANKIQNTNLQAQVKEKTNLEKLQEQINDLEKKYDITQKDADNDFSLMHKEFINRTEDEIRQQAENKLNYPKQVEKENIEKNFENSLQSLIAKKESERKNAEKEKKEVEGYYAEAMERAGNDALKRGIQRSSIVINNLNAFENSKIEKLMEIDAELNSEIDVISDAIDKLTKEKDKALADLDIEYAFKLNQEIEDLKDKIAEKNDEILEYNNKIAQVEEDYKNKYAKQQSQNDVSNEKEQKELEQKKSEEIQKTIEDFLNSLTKKEALEALSENYVRELLGNNYSFILLSTQQRKD